MWVAQWEQRAASWKARSLSEGSGLDVAVGEGVAEIAPCTKETLST